jgi:hypothetical protein
VAHRRILSGLALLVLAVQACSAPAQTDVPSPTAVEATPTATTAPEPPLALSLSEAIAAGVDGSQWSEGQGIVRGLRYLVGELSPAEALGDCPLAQHPECSEGHTPYYAQIARPRGDEACANKLN